MAACSKLARLTKDTCPARFVSESSSVDTPPSTAFVALQLVAGNAYKGNRFPSLVGRPRARILAFIPKYSPPAWDAPVAKDL